MSTFQYGPLADARPPEPAAAMTAASAVIASGDKLCDVELSIRGILRGFGLKVGKVSEETIVCALCNAA